MKKVLSEEHINKIRKAMEGNKHFLGKKHSEESRAKIRLSLLGIKHPEERIIKNRESHKGIRHSEETKAKMRKSSVHYWQGIPSELQPNWKGGLSFEPYSKDFSKQLKLKVRARDNYTCQECKYSEKQLGYNLTVHHIDYDKKNNILSNLISLCRSCNSKVNWNRDNWKNYFQQGLNLEGVENAEGV